MIRHNLLLTYRNFKRFKISFFINLAGLSMGLACTVLIYLWIENELSIDTFNENDSRLYQVMRNEPTHSTVKTEEYTPGLLARAIASEIPEAEHAVAVVPPSTVYRGVLSAGNAHTYAMPQFVDKDYFNVFSCTFIQGNQRAALSDKRAVSISEGMALKLFHTTKNVIGKILRFENEYFNGRYMVSGIFIPQPDVSRQFDILFSYELYLEKRPEIREWANGGPSTYVVLKQGAGIEQVNQKISSLLKRQRKGTKESLFLQKYSERYLYGNYENGMPVSGRMVYVRLFLVIALFILGIACINFMNLSTAKASARMKEVGIKKVMGANRRSLLIQYMSESMLLSSLSLFVALLVAELLLPQFNQITGKSLTLAFESKLVIALLAITIFTGIISGSYPALYLSGFHPAMALKGRLTHTTAALLTRKGLVIFQFSIAIILMISVLVVYKQIQYVQTKDPGYDKDNIISFSREGKLVENFQVFISRLKNIPGVVNASYMYGNVTGGVSSRSGGFSWEKQTPGGQQTQFDYLDVDYGLIETLGLKLESGRAFSRDFGADSSAIIFNEAAIKAMGIKDPIGKTVSFYGKRQIIGVVKDFHFESLFQQVKPFFFKIEYEKGGNILVKIKSGTEREAISRIEKVYKEFNEGFPFEYKFLDEDYQAQYAAENRISVLSRYFAGIAVFISCLGLFGLTAYMVERRSKEIAIRKTLGCSEFGVIYLLSAHFTGIIFTAMLIAFPISYLIARNWLDSFAYQIHLEWWYFVSAALLAVFMAWVAVGTQIVKVARINPAACLKE